MTRTSSGRLPGISPLPPCLCRFDTQFWLRLAARSDACGDEEGKQQLSSLARHVQALVDGMVAQTRRQLDDSHHLLMVSVGFLGLDVGMGWGAMGGWLGGGVGPARWQPCCR